MSGIAWPRRAREFLLVAVAIALDLYVYDSDDQWRWGDTAPAWLVPTLAVVVYVTLPARWRWPRGIFVLQWGYGVAGIVLPAYAPFAGILIALHAVASSESRRWSGAALALSFLALEVDNYNSAAARTTHTLQFFISLSLAWLAILTAVWLAGRRTHLTARRGELQRLRDEQAAADALRGERIELARELHDGLARSLHAMIYQARGANAVLSHGSNDLPGVASVRECLTRIEEAGVRSVDELRRLLEVLRRAYPGVQDPDTTWSTPSLDGIPQVIALARDGGLAVDIAIEGDATNVEPAVGAAAYRVIEEGLTNASKYGGPDARVRIAMTYSSSSLEVKIQSPIVTPNPGTPPALRSGFGLKGLRERVALTGGVLMAGPSEDHAEYVLQAVLPLAATAALPLTEKAYE